VIITCPQCATQYRYDLARFGGSQRKRLKCTKCATVFEAVNPEVDHTDSTNVRPKKKTVAREAPASPDTDRIRLEPEQPELPALAPLPRDKRISLAVIAGTQAGTVYPVSRPRIYLGRGSNMDIQLRDAEISRRHAMLEVRGATTVLVDLGSTNGSFVGGARIQQAEVANQTEFTLGSTTLMLIVTDTREMT